MPEPKSQENEISLDRLAELLNEGLSPRISSHHRLRTLFPGAQRRPIHGHRRPARNPV